MTPNNSSFFFPIVLACFVVLGCSSDSSRQASGKRHSLDGFMADRPQAGDLLRQHPALEQWLRDAWTRPVEGLQIRWSNDKPPHGSRFAETAILPEDGLAIIYVSDKCVPPDQLVALCFE